MKSSFVRRLAVLAVMCALSAPAFGGAVEKAFDLLHSNKPSQAPLTAQVENGFSPEGNAEALVLKTIGAARKTIRLSAYSFTSPAVVRELVNASRRGVEVAVVVDYKNNITDDRSGKAEAALNLLVNAGIATRTISRYASHHDKFIVVDGLHVETGSFNFSQAAATRNSENVLVLWNAPQVAASYLQHWQSRYDQGTDYKSRY